MKIRILFFSIFLQVFYHVLTAQISVTETKSSFSGGTQPCLKTEISEADDDFCIKEWKRLLDNYKNEKVKKSGNEVFGDNVLIPALGNNPVDFYTTFDYRKKDNKTIVCLAVDLGGAYLNSSDHSDKFREIKKIFTDYAKNTQKKYWEKKLEDEQDVLKKLQKKKASLEEDNKEMTEDNFRYENDIKKNEKEIADTKVKLEIKKKEVENQKKVVQASSSAVKEQQKASENIYEKLLDQQKDLEKDIRNLEEKNESLKQKISRNKEKIKENEQEIKNLNEKINSQNQVINELQSKIKNI